MSKGLTGQYHVRPVAAAFREAKDLFPRVKDYQEARRHALKLRFWPHSQSVDSGQVIDLDWEFIKSMPGSKVGELCVHNVIGNNDNIRLIFHVSDVLLPEEPLRNIWILSVIQKKSQEFTTNNIKTFKSRLAILKRRVYGIV